MGVKGCLTTIIAFIICAFFIGLIEKHTDAIVVIALVGLMLVIVAGVFYYRWNSKRKQAKEEARTLLDKIEKELRLPYSIIFHEDLQEVRWRNTNSVQGFPSSLTLIVHLKNSYLKPDHSFLWRKPEKHHLFHQRFYCFLEIDSISSGVYEARILDIAAEH